MAKGLRFTGSRLKRMLHLAAMISLLIGIFVPFGLAKAEGVLTVAEALQRQSSGGKVTVEGYIVGHATGSRTANFSSPFTNDFNVLIADQANQRNTSDLLNVQLTSAYRGQFGLSGHPELIGSKIRVTGTLDTYNNFGGLKSPSTVELVSGSEPGEPGNPGNPSDPGNPDPGNPGQPGTTLPDGKGKKVLFDNTHAQTAGAADWVIDGAFSDFAGGLRNAGFTVDQLNRSIPFTYGEQAITYDKLRQYDVFIIGEANVPFKASEQAALLQYVKNGGGVFFISDHYNADRNKNRWDSSEVMNGYRRGAYTNPAKGMNAEEAASPAMQGLTSSDWLAANFGVRFRYNALGDVNATDLVAADQSFGIMKGVRSIAMHAGSTLAIIDPAKSKGIAYIPAGTKKWGNAVDQGVYNGGGRAEGPFAAISKVGQGKAAFIGDSSPVEDATPKYVREENGQSKKTYDGFKEVDDATFLVQTVQWLAWKQDYTKLSDVAGLTLDQPTKLLPFEEPADSTEPQPEPWSAPAAGYKWYDSKTYKPGSYGAAS